MKRTAPLWCVALACACTGNPQVAAVDAPDAAGLAVLCSAADIDSDADGLSDDCELEFARTFAPLLRTASRGCNWDTTVAPARLGGEYLFAVHPVAPERVRVAYLPAYYRDCGWSGIKCALPLVDCSPHVGDSEAVMLDLLRAGARDRWRADAIFLSAHCFTSGDDCRWYGGNTLARFVWVDDSAYGAPIVWVAEGRQANYPSQQACDAGHWWIDTCDRNDAAYRFPIRDRRQNVGSRIAPSGSDGGCLTTELVGSASALPQPDIEECFWRLDARFGGWQVREAGEGVTPYARYLLEVAEF